MKIKSKGILSIAISLSLASCTAPATDDVATESDSSEESTETSEESSEESSDESDSTDTNSASTGALAISTDSISAAYPEGLTVTAFPTEAADTEVVAGTLAIGTELTSGLALNDPNMTNTLDPNMTNTLDPNQTQHNTTNTVDQNSDLGQACSGPNDTVERLWFDVETERYTNVSEVFAHYEAKNPPQKAPVIDPAKICEQPEQPPEGEFAPPPGSFDPNKKSASQKLIAEQEILQGKAESCFGPDVFEALQFESSSGESCFEFDQGIVSGKSCESKEACLVSFSRGLVESASAKVEGGLGLLQALVCVAKKEGLKDLPANGETLSLTAAMKERKPKDNTKAPTFSKAEISRTDTSDGTVTYVSTIEITLPDGRASTYNLSHSPSSEKGNEEYSGTFWFSRSTGGNPDDTNCEDNMAGGEPMGGTGGDPMDDGQVAVSLVEDSFQNVGPNTQTMPQEFQKYNPPIANCILKKLGQDVTSVTYERSGTGDDTRLKMEIREARINTYKDNDPFTEEGLVDYNTNANMTATNAEQLGSFPWESNAFIGQISYIAFDMNPLTSEGTLSYWKNPGGNYTEWARGFIFEMNYDDDTGLLNGCGIAGAALEDNKSSIRQATYAGIDLAPTGLYTPMVCWSDGKNGQGDNRSSRVWKQCFAQNTEGIYEVDTAKTTSEKGYDIIKVEDVQIQGPKASQIKKRPRR